MHAGGGVSAVYTRNILFQQVKIIGSADPHAVLGFEMEGGRDGHIQVIIESVRGGDSVAQYDVVPEIRFADILSLQLNAQGVQGYQVGKRVWPVDHRKEQAAMMVYIIPIVDRGVNLSDDQVAVILIVELDKATFNTGQEGGGRGAIVTNHELTQERDPVGQLGRKKEIMLPDREIGIGMVSIIKRVFQVPEYIELSGGLLRPQHQW